MTALGFLPGSAVAATGTAPASSPPAGSGASAIEIPASFKIEWMRGIVVANHAKGAIVTKRNENVKAGVIFTKINEQPVTSAADLLAKVSAADPRNISITTETITRSRWPFHADVWAEGLRYSDTPFGVRIDASEYPDEAGRFLEAVNGSRMASAAQVRALLLQIMANPDIYLSRSFRDPGTPEELKAADAAAATSTARAYFVVGMQATAAGTRNPMCYSTPFNIQFEREGNGLGDNDRAQAALKQHEASFLEKCSRHGQASGVVKGNVEGLTSGFPMTTPDAGDVVVQMP